MILNWKDPHFPMNEETQYCFICSFKINSSKQECMEMAGIDITDLKDLIPPGMSLKLIKEQERMKEENSKMPEVDTDALQDFVVPDLTSNTVVNYGE